MTVARSVADVLRNHVNFELESIDRMYLNLYVPVLQTEQGIAWYFCRHHGYKVVSSALMAPLSRAFVGRLEAFAERQGLDLITFRRHERKDDIAKEYLARFKGEEGVLFIGKAQEKATVVRTERRRNPQTGATYPWLAKSTALVNQYYIYCVDRDFGPFFLKFCSYFPFNGKLCINGHEYLKRQLARRDVEFTALDNGIAACDDPRRAQRIADGLNADRIDALARKWFRRLPHPLSRQDRAAGFRYDISILQSEFALTQVFDRPLTGRLFFEQVIRDNLDGGRPDQVQLIFDRRVLRTTPGRFRTRVITEGVVPSLHIDFKSSRIKQYFKEGRALRTETLINNTYDFNIGRRLENLPALREVGFSANRRLLDVQRIGHDCHIGQDAFDQIHRPAKHNGQRAAALRFGDPRVLALFASLALFRLLPQGFRNRDLREHVTPLSALPPEALSQGMITYDLRRMRLHGLIERIPRSHRYRVTDFGFRAALLLTRAHTRLVQNGLGALQRSQPPAPSPLRAALLRVDAAIEQLWASAA
jgi:hypothetical protein